MHIPKHLSKPSCLKRKLIIEFFNVGNKIGLIAEYEHCSVLSINDDMLNAMHLSCAMSDYYKRVP